MSFLVPLHQSSCLTSLKSQVWQTVEHIFLFHRACLNNCIFFLEFTASVSPVLLRGSLADLGSESVDLMDYTDLTLNS